MSKLEELIQQYCPGGVEMNPILDVLVQSITDGPHETPVLHEKGVPFISVEAIHDGIVDLSKCRGYITKEYDEICAKKYKPHVGDVFLVKSASIGKVAMVTTNDDFNIWSPLAAMRCNTNRMLPRFLYYVLQTEGIQKEVFKKASKSSQPNLSMRVLEQFLIPVPPIPVQEEVVSLLDTYTELQTELQAELQAELQKRLQQYNYYRDNLFLFEGRSDVEWKKLGEIASIKTGRRFVRTDIRECGVPCFHYGDIYTYYGLTATQTKGYLDEELAKKLRFAQPNDVVVVCAGENDMDIGVGVAWLGDKPAVVHDACCILHHNQNPRYISHFLRTHNYHLQMKKYVKNGKISSLPASGLAEALIPLPSLEEQEKIASILDGFDALTKDLVAGLPAEIEKRRQQYEYYRDKLLTFKRK